MGKPTGFKEYQRQDVPHRMVEERVKDFFEIDEPLPEEALLRQAARCMDCGIPFCHGIGCPLHNRIPEFNDKAYHGRWREACEILHSTNNFPEITGRICPAPCEAACTLMIDQEPMLIRHIELQIVERGFAENWIQPEPPREKTGKRVAVVGSGPAGLAAAQQLARLGHEVTVFEKHKAIGGLLRYGIPDYKLPKHIIDRRLDQMRAEGVRFETGVDVGEDISLKYLRRMFDAICLTLGAGEPRDLKVVGRGFENIEFATDYLIQQNRLNAGEAIGDAKRLDARGKIVVVIGGGDTGSDCVGTANRQGAKEVHQFEILPKPPEEMNPDTPWPNWPQILRTSTSHEEGCHRRWGILTKKFSGTDVHVSELHGVEVEWQREAGQWKMSEVPGRDFSIRVDLVLVAMGFLHVAHKGLVERFELDVDNRGNLKTDADHQTSRPGIFAAGDASAGASLIVRAIQSGRDTASTMDQWLMV